MFLSLKKYELLWIFYILMAIYIKKKTDILAWVVFF